MDSNGIVELLTTMDKMKNLIANQKQELADTEQDLREREAEWKEKSSKIQYDMAELEDVKNDLHNSTIELNKLVADLVEAKKQNSAIKREISKKQKIKPSSSDLDRLQHGREKYDIYKRITGVRWNFEDIDNYVQGAVTNRKDYIQAFNYPINTKKLENKLWMEMEKSFSTTNTMINAEEDMQE